MASKQWMRKEESKQWKRGGKGKAHNLLFCSVSVSLLQFIFEAM